MNREFKELITDRFQDVTKITEGGFGEVYAGIDRVRSQVVAIKVFKAHYLCLPDMAARFEQEIELAIDLAAAAPDSFPQIIGVIREDETLALVMEYVESVLSILIKKNRFETMRVVDIALKILKALHAAYVAGVVLRDIKPENVLIGNDGSVKLCDFGISKGKRPEAGYDGKIWGTLDYIAPEYFRDGFDGLPDQPCDHRGDLYSLGILLYRMLAGHYPYEGMRPGNICDAEEAHTNEKPIPLPESIPAELRTCVYKLLIKNPRRRYQTPWQAARDLALFAVSQNPKLRLVDPYYLFLGRASDAYGHKEFPHSPRFTSSDKPAYLHDASPEVIQNPAVLRNFRDRLLAIGRSVCALFALKRK